VSRSFDRIDVIIPILNEEEMVGVFFDRISSLPLPLHFIFVDNASTDRTKEIVRSFPRATLIEHEKNEGYGGSILDGIGRSDAEVIVIIDADAEYPPEVIPALIDALEENEAVYTSRFLAPGDVDMPLFRRVGNRAITGSFNVLFGQNLTDLYTGCKALRRSALDGLALERKGFEHVLELGVKLALKGIRIAEVPIRYEPRSTGRSKMRHVSETLKFIYLLLRYRLTG
jgi:glycosyltransferase involved in cell wall biosynthesis